MRKEQRNNPSHSPTIYIGECSSGVYAVPALVDVNTAIISHRGSQLLLGGPPNTQGTLKQRQAKTASDAEEEKNAEVLLLGESLFNSSSLLLIHDNFIRDFWCHICLKSLIMARRLIVISLM